MATQPPATPEPTPAPAPDPAREAAAAAQIDLEAEVADVFGFEESSAPAGEPAPPAPPAGGDVAPAAPAAPSPPAVPAPSTPATPAPPAPAPTDGPAPAPVPPAPAPTPAPTEEELKRASLEAQVQALTAQLEAARAGTPATPTPPSPATPAAPSYPGTALDADGGIRYALSIPPDVAAGLEHDDANTRLAAMAHVINSTATIIHRNVCKAFEDRLGAFVAERETGDAERQLREQMAAMQEDYFKDFPQHREATVIPILQQAAQEMAAEFPMLPYDANYKAALGARVNAKLQVLRGGTPPAPSPAPAPPPPPTPAPKPAAFLPSGAPGGGGGFMEADADVISETFAWPSD